MIVIGPLLLLCLLLLFSRAFRWLAGSFLALGVTFAVCVHEGWAKSDPGVTLFLLIGTLVFYCWLDGTKGSRARKRNIKDLAAAIRAAEKDR